MHAAAVGSGIGLVLTNSSLELKTMRIRSADPELVCKDPHLGLRHHWSLEAGSVQRAVELRTFSFVVFPPVTLTKRCRILGPQKNYLIISYLTPLLELGFPSALFADFFAAVAPRRCHWGVCRTRPVKIEFKVH